MSVSWLDALILLAFAWTVWVGYQSGLVLEVLNLVKLVVSVIVAIIFGPVLGHWLQAQMTIPALVAMPFGAALVFIGAQIALGGLIALIVRPILGPLHMLPVLGMLDRVGGIAIAVAQTVLWLAVALAALLPLLLLTVQGPVLVGIQESRLSPPLAGLGHRLAPEMEALLRPPTADLLPTLPIAPRHVGEDQTVRMHFPADLSVSVDTGAEKTMLDYVNQQRTLKHLVPLVLDPALTQVARAHSQDMFHRSYFAHETPDGRSPFDRMRAAGIGYQVAGENIAYAPNVDLADDGLINSPEHRDNILRPEFRRLGVGAVSGGLFEEMFTQDFTG